MNSATLTSSFITILLRYLSIPVLVFMLIAGCNRSGQNNDQSIQIIDAWTRPFNAASGLTTAIYLTLDNRTDSLSTLTGARITYADTIEIHQSIQDNGIMRMRPVSSVEIPGFSTVTFQPGGNHLMVKGLQLDLVEGDSLRLFLHFGDGKRVRTTADVRWE